MFVSKRAFVVVVSLAVAVGCGSSADEDSSSPSGEPSNGAGESAANGAAGSGGESSGGASSGDGAGSSSGGSSSGGSSSGGVTPAAVALTCTQCSTFAADQAAGGTIDAWKLCSGGAGVPESYALYTAYLGCLCSGPCASECETSLCALIPKAATPTCKSCLALNNAACSTPKSACLADQ